MIYISYGQPKSASTYVVWLINRILRVHYKVSPREFRHNVLPKDYRNDFQFVSGRLIETMNEFVPADFVCPVKTHAPPDETIVRMLASAEVKACASFRDPRDVALSLLDIGEKERTKETQRPAFANIHTIDDVVPKVAKGLRTLKKWLAVEGVLPVPYEMTARRPDLLVMRIIRQLDLGEMDEEEVLRPLEETKRSIPEFNKGIPGRYRTEMSPKDLDLFNRRFGDDIAMIEALTRQVAADSGWDIGQPVDHDTTPAQ